MMKTRYLLTKAGMRRFLLMSLFFLGARTLYGQSYTLRQVLDSIEANNPGLQQFGLKSLSSIEEGKAAAAWEEPRVGLGVSEFPYGPVDKNAGGMMPRKMMMLRLEQMFPNFARQKKEKAYDQSFMNQNRDDKATMKNLLFVQAKMAFFEAYVAEKKLVVINRQDDQLQLLLKISEGRLAYDRAGLPDIYKARAKLEALASMKIDLVSKSSEAALIINSLMNRPVDSPLQIDTSGDPEQGLIDILPIDSAYLLTRRSDIVRHSDQIHSIQLNQEVISSDAHPTFGIGWENMRMNSGKYMYSAMATLSIPIVPWFSKGYRAKVRALDYQIESIHKVQQNQVNKALGDIHRDWLKLQASRKVLQAYRDKIIPAYAKSWQASLSAYGENTGNVFETLAAWNDLTEQKIQFWDKVMDMLHLRILLEAEMQQD